MCSIHKPCSLCHLIIEENHNNSEEDIEVEKRDGKFYVVKGFDKVRSALEKGEALVAIKMVD